MDGKYKVIFCVTEHRGRVSQQDVTTMKLVLDAAPEIGDKYGIIVNMVSKGVLKKLNTEEVYHDFNNSMLAGIDEKNRCVYSNIIFFGTIDELEDEDDILVPPDTFKDANGTTLTEVIYYVDYYCYRHGNTILILSMVLIKVFKLLYPCHHRGLLISGYPAKI